MLPGHSKLHSEPIALNIRVSHCGGRISTHRGKLLNIVIRSTERSKTYFLAELSKSRIRKERDMTKQLVTDILKI